MLQKLREDEPQAEQPRAELDSLGHTDWVRAAPAGTWGAGARRAWAWAWAWTPPRAEGRVCLAAQARLWVQLMRELRHGVKLRKVQQQEFNPLPTEFQLTPFEMLMQDIRARNYKLRKVMVSWAHAPPPSRLGSASLACAGPVERRPGRREGGGEGQAPGTGHPLNARTAACWHHPQNLRCASSFCSCDDREVGAIGPMSTWSI